MNIKTAEVLATEFELIKAFLMHQVYRKSENVNSTNENIKGIKKTVTDIYRSIEDVDGYFSEDHLDGSFLLVEVRL
ncbi:hypothetical protein AGMMS50267_17900 [Spirochaetia bacterium]|nr:hypothetical protein AGMMS50267_17900 [Spirochaetia bacterium]